MVRRLLLLSKSYNEILLIFRYMFFFQTTIVPELYVEADDFAYIKDGFRKKSTGLVNQDYITDGDIDIYKYTLSQPGKSSA